MELFTNQVLAGIATGAIYACMALAVVMIYQAIDHLNFAQGEMAMFSTFISWQLMQWGLPYWWAFLLTLAFSFAGGIVIERLLFKPLAKAPILTNVAGFIALFAIINSVAGLTWDFTIKQYPTPFGSSPFLGSQLISTHQAGMIGVTVVLLILLYFFFQFTRMGLAMRAAASLPESARLVGINTSWMIAPGWGMAVGIGSIAGMLTVRVLFLVVRLFVKNFSIFPMTTVLIYGIAVLALNILTGGSGQFSLGQSAFYAVGAYTSAILIEHAGMNYALTLPIAGLICFAFGFLFGLPALRLSGVYLALATFALATAMPQLLKLGFIEHWTGGVQGLVVTKPDAPFGLPISQDVWLYYFTPAIAIATYVAAVHR